MLSSAYSPHKKLNILQYRTLSHLIICMSYKLLEMVKFFWPTLCVQLKSGGLIIV